MRYDDFLDIFKDSTSHYSKIKKEEYLPHGKYPIIDQGQAFIGGFTDDENLISSENLPVIIFGDHTKVFKYVDFPFAIGADGVKVLTLKEETFNALYYFHYLKGTILTDAGYSRHFKFLKEKKLPVPESILSQLHIANILTKAESLIAQRKESIRLLDEYLKSVFLEMFGDPLENPKNFEIKTLKDFYINPKEGTKCGPFGSALKRPEYTSSGVPVWNMDNISVDGNFVSNINLFITEEKYSQLSAYSTFDGDIIISRAGTVGKMCVLKSGFDKSIISTNLIRVRLNTKLLLSVHFVSLMKYCKNRMARLRTGSDDTFTHMNTGILDSLKFPVPPLELQTKFAQIVEKTENLKAQYQQSLQELENLYGSLSQKAFKGELNLKDEGLLLAAEPEITYNKK